MNTIKNKSEGMEIMVSDANGNQKSIAHAGYTIRPGAGFSVGFDVFDAELVAANLADVREFVNAFISDAMEKCAAAGMPVGE